MEINEKAADFTLEGIDKNGNEIEFTLSDHAGKNIILFFYPKDNGTYCTMEAIDFSNNFGKLSELAEVVGISPDDIKSHRDFHDKYDLEITLLSDPNGEVLGRYGVCEATDLEHKKFVRSTYLINKDGKIVTMWKDVDVNGHVEDVMKALKNCG